MKIPEKEKRQQPTVTKKSTTAKSVNLTEYRKKKRNTKRTIKLVIIGVVLVVFAYVWANADKIFEPLRGIASKIETKTSSDVGFPISLPGSAGYSFQSFGNNFSLLTDTYLYAYETSGAQIYALRHGYGNPVQVTSSRRILLYDKSAYSFGLYNKTSQIYEKTLDEKIVYGALGENDMAAIVTGSSRYSNILYVYDSGGNWKYTRKFADENVFSTAFPENGDYIYVATLGVDSGEIVTTFYKLSLKSEDGYEWKYSVKTNSLPCGMYAGSNELITVCDNRVIALELSDGSLIGEFSYNGTLRDFVISGTNTAIYYNDVSTNKNMLVSLNEKMEALASIQLTSNAQQLLLDRDIYVLDGTSVKRFDAQTLEITQTVQMSSDYSAFVKIDNELFLLGYDVVDCERIN